MSKRTKANSLLIVEALFSVVGLNVISLSTDILMVFPFSSSTSVVYEILMFPGDVNRIGSIAAPVWIVDLIEGAFPLSLVVIFSWLPTKPLKLSSRSNFNSRLNDLFN